MEKCSYRYKSINAELLRRAARGIFGTKKEINIDKSVTEKKSSDLNIICKAYELNGNKIEFAKLNISGNLDCLLLSISGMENIVPIRKELMVCKERDSYRIIIAYECNKQLLGEREGYLIFDIRRGSPIKIVKIVPDYYKGRAIIESKKLEFSNRSEIFIYLIGSRLFESMQFFEPTNIKDILNIIQQLNYELRSLLLEFRSECDKIKDKKICYFIEDVLRDHISSYYSLYRYI